LLLTLTTLSVVVSDGERNRRNSAGISGADWWGGWDGCCMSEILKGGNSAEGTYWGLGTGCGVRVSGDGGVFWFCDAPPSLKGSRRVGTPMSAVSPVKAPLSKTHNPTTPHPHTCSFNDTRGQFS